MNTKKAEPEKFDSDYFSDRVASLMGNDDSGKYELLYNDIASTEILALPSKYFLDLLLPSSIILEVPRIDQAIALCSSGDAVKRSIAKRRIVFDPEEVMNLCWATENDRVWVADIFRFCGSKQRWPKWRLTLKEAMGPVANPDPFQNWTFDRIFRRLKVTFRGVEVPKNVQ